MDSSKIKVNFRFAEKIIRIICWASVVLCALVALLYIISGAYWGGALVLVVCLACGFLNSHFFISKLKNRFLNHKYKRVIIVAAYTLILIIVFTACFTLIGTKSYTENQLNGLAVDFIKSELEAKYVNDDLRIDEILIEDCFKNVNSYFYKISCDYYLNGGRVFKEVYLKINKENARIEVISPTDYLLAYNSVF